MAFANDAALVEDPSLGLGTSSIFQLPCGYRPGSVAFASATGAVGNPASTTSLAPVLVEIEPDGHVLAVAPDLVKDAEPAPVLEGFISLDVVFDADAPAIGSECDDAPSRDLFVATDGNDANSGTTTEEPLATIGRAIDLVRPGDKIYLMGGTYPVDETIDLGGLSGVDGSPITISAFPGDHPVLDAVSMGDRVDLNDFRPLIRLTNAEWLNIVGIETRNAPLHGIQCLGCQHVSFTSIESDQNEGAGILIFDTSGGGHPTHDVAVVNCDLHDNHDRLRHGGESDGLSIYDVQGTGVSVTGTRTYNNSDDGVDLAGTESAVSITSSWSFGNGIDRWSAVDGYDSQDFAGSGIGFKLGGSSSTHEVAPAVAHVVIDSASWSNGRMGFATVGNAGALRLFHDTAWDNAWRGFQVPAISGSTVRAAANLSIDNRGEVAGYPTDPVRDVVAADAGGVNSWDDVGVTASSADVILLPAARSDAEGSRSGTGLPSSSFLHLVAGSDLIDAALASSDAADTHVSLGSAPDYGAFEHD